MEEWRFIKGYENQYEVSNLGNIRNKFNRVLKPALNKNGYLTVALCKDGFQKTFYIHRLVAEAYISNISNNNIINHIDEDKTNNCVENLEWCDMKYNTNYGSGMKKSTEKRSKKIYQYDMNMNLIKVWDSSNECGRGGFSQGNIIQCCKGNRKQHKGYIWKY